MKSRINPHFHLILSLGFIPVILYGGAILKALVMLYAIWLTLKKDAGSLPALAIIISFMSNSYVIYFAMAILSIFNFRILRNYRVHLILIALLIFLPLVAYMSISNILIFHTKAGLVFNQFQFYFSMFSFFFGIIIMETFDNKVMKALILTFVLLYIFNLVKEFNDSFVFIRLFFYIIPFFSGYIIYYIFRKYNNASKALLLISVVILISSLVLKESTFTIYITTLFALLLSILYFKRKTTFLIKATGVPAFIVVSLLMIYAVRGYEKNDFSMYQGMSMSDIRSYKSLTNRMQMKFFDDRAPIWIGAWEGINFEKNWLPPLKVKEIRAATRKSSTVEFEYHSHNIYLELIRTNGIIMGILLSVIFIIFALLGRKVYLARNVDPLFIVFISTSLSSVIIGSLTGIYSLLISYAGIGLTIIGIAYSKYFLFSKTHKEALKK